MERNVQADRDVAFAVMQEASERLVQFMTPKEAMQVILSFGIAGLLEVAGYDELRELIMKATTEALRGQLARGMMGPSWPPTEYGGRRLDS